MEAAREMTLSQQPIRAGVYGTDDDGFVTFTLSYDGVRQAEVELAPFLSAEGIYCVTPSPLPPSTVLRFKVLLPDGFLFIEGTGVVFWTRVSIAADGRRTRTRYRGRDGERVSVYRPPRGLAEVSRDDVLPRAGHPGRRGPRPSVG